MAPLAMLVFSRSGYYQSKIADIAREAGIGKGTVYEYFKNKEALFMELFAFLIEDHLQYLTGSRESAPSARRKLEDIINGTFQAFGRMENIYYIFLDLKTRHLKESGTTFYHEQFARLYREFRRELAGIIVAGNLDGSLRKVNPDQVASLIIAAMEGIMNQWIADRSAFTLEQISAAFKDMIGAFVATAQNPPPAQ